MHLFKASQQWAIRPADETFSNITSAYQAARDYAKTAAEKANVPLQSIRTEANGNEIYLTGRGGVPARVANWAFGQLSRIAQAPAGYLRTLPPTLAAQNINYGLKTATEKEPESRVNILAHQNGDLLVRALTSDKYRRIWNYEVLQRMLPLEVEGWTCPTPFRTRVDQAAKPDPTVYVSDHDLFAFQVREDVRISEPGNPDGLARGFFVENSEVGASALKVTTFLYRFMCGNHIVWGAKDVSELAVRHVGKARGNLQTMFLGLKEYANESASELEGKIKEAKTRLIDANPEHVLDVIFAKLRGRVSREALEKAQTLAVDHQLTDGDPRSFWGFAQGMTRYSQELAFADQRVQVDKAAADVIELAF